MFIVCAPGLWQVGWSSAGRTQIWAKGTAARVWEGVADKGIERAEPVKVLAGEECEDQHSASQLGFTGIRKLQADNWPCALRSC